MSETHRHRQRRWIMEEIDSNHESGYDSDCLVEDLEQDLEHIRMQGEGSSSGNYQDLVLFDPSHNRPNSTTFMVESIENETEKLLNERMVARAAHLEKVKDLVDANHSCIVEAFDFEALTEWSTQETSPLCGSQLVAQSLQRSQAMLAAKQSLEKFQIPGNVVSRIDDALDNEKQLAMSVTKTARNAGEQQRQLCDMEQNAYQAYLALIEKQKKERMELFITFREEKEHHLNLWAVSRTDTLDIVQNIESNSQHMLEMLNILVETTKKQETNLEAEVVRVREEAIEETSNLCKSECKVCFYYIEGPSSEQLGTLKTRELQQRSCLIPCNHAMICLPCATEIWESSSKLCPFCKVRLTTKPLPLYLG